MISHWLLFMNSLKGSYPLLTLYSVCVTNSWVRIVLGKQRIFIFAGIRSEQLSSRWWSVGRVSANQITPSAFLTNQRQDQGRGDSVVTRWARRAIQELEVFTSERGKIREQTRTEPGAPTQWEQSYLRQIPTPAIKPRVSLYVEIIG